MVYNYTVPRAPIAAQYSSPGPCYGLPGLVGQKGHDTRSVHNKGPAYPFGTKHGKTQDDCSPGPAYLPSGRIYRDGKSGEPHYSLYGRPKNGTAAKTPGPGAYQPENSGQTAHPRAAAYSFGGRHKTRKTDDGPAPNNYTVPGMLGKTVPSQKRQAPAYSLTSRSKIGGFHEDLQRTPGPGTYTVTDPSVNHNKLPQYSITGRSQMPGDSTQKPGPGSHSPERVYVNKRQLPAFSFGIRHSQYEAPLIVEVAE